MERAEAPQDIVLAAMQDYDWESVRPFVESLRATGYAGEIRFFVTGADRRTLEELRVHGVEVERPRRLRLRAGGRVFEPYTPRTTRLRWHLQPLYRHLVAARARFARDPRSAAGALAGALANVEVARYFWYRSHLARAGGRYRNVMLADVRDVVFLADPFSFDVGDDAWFFEEDERFTIAQQVNNSGWMHGAHGQGALDELGDRRIVCSGITIGAAPAVLAYVDVMVDRLWRVPRQYRGIDQGVHNYVLHKGLVPHARMVPNREAPVLTVGLMDADDAAETLRRRANEIRVVHQYDRHPQVCEVLASLTPAASAA